MLSCAIIMWTCVSVTTYIAMCMNVIKCSDIVSHMHVLSQIFTFERELRLKPGINITVTDHKSQAHNILRTFFMHLYG